MMYDELVKGVEGARKRLAVLEQQAEGAPAQPWALHEAIAEVDSSLEELRAASEELRHQNEELVTTRQAVEAERQRYRELFEFAPDGYLVTDPNGIICEANRATAAMVNVHQRFLLGMPLLVFVAKKDHPTLHDHLRAVQSGTEAPQRWEIELQPHATASFPATLTVGCVQNAEGRLVGLRWLLRDITETKRAEGALRKVQEQLEFRIQERTLELEETNAALRHEIAERGRSANALRESEERYRSLVELSPEAIGVHREGKWVYLNPAGLRLFGATAHTELFGRSIKDFVHPDDRAAVAADICRVEGGNGPTPVQESRMVRLDGQLVEIEAVGTSVVFQGAAATLVILKDITARKRAEEERERLLKELEAEKIRWQATVGGMLDAVITCDAIGRVTYMNAACSRMLGQEMSPETELEGSPASRQYHRPDGPPFETETIPLKLSAMTGEEIRNVEAIRQMPDGSARIIVWNAAPLRDPYGRSTGGVAVGRDITDQRMTELSIRAAHDTLKRRLGEEVIDGGDAGTTPAAHPSEPGRNEEEIRRLMQEMERYVKALAALDRASRALTGSLNVEEVLQILMDEVRTFLNTEGVAVLRYSPEQETLVFVAAQGAGAEQLVGQRIPVHASILGWAFRERRPTRVEDVRSDPRYYPKLEGLAGVPLRSLLAVPLMARGKVNGVVATTNKPDGPFTEDDERILAALASAAALAIENANLYGAERRRRQQIEAMRAIAGEIARELDLSKVLRLIAEHAGRLLGTRSAAVWFWDEDRQALVAQILPEPKEWTDRPYLRLGEGLVGIVAERREGQIINDYRRWPQALPFVLARGTITAAVAEPLLYRDRLLGVLVVDNEGIERTFAREDHELLALFADHAVIAIANAQLFGEVQGDHERLRQLSLRLVEAQETERRALARELHDEIGQSLTALRLLLERKAIRLGQGEQSEMDEAQDLVQALQSRVGELSLNLRPSMLDDQGLLPALIWNIDRFQSRTGIRVSFKHVGLEAKRFPQAVEGAVYRVVQEALTNVARHAGVREAAIRLWVTANALWVQIEDLGIGFDPEAALASYASSGLLGMRERVALVGGRLRIDSAPRSGTSILAEFPLSA
jgi:PAS domain S-box-containing protein